MQTLTTSVRLIAALTLLTGAAYPLLITGAASILAPKAASGSLVVRDGKIIGSSLLAQKTTDPKYFWPRPSAGDYATVSSAASNQGPTSAALVKAIGDRRAQFGADAPADLLTASGSGLDPHISPAAAHHQASRVAEARKVPVAEIQALIDRLTEGPQLGFLGEPRVNVLSLNLALDAKP